MLNFTKSTHFKIIAIAVAGTLFMEIGVGDTFLRKVSPTRSWKVSTTRGEQHLRVPMSSWKGKQVPIQSGNRFRFGLEPVSSYEVWADFDKTIADRQSVFWAAWAVVERIPWSDPVRKIKKGFEFLRKGFLLAALRNGEVFVGSSDFFKGEDLDYIIDYVNKRDRLKQKFLDVIGAIKQLTGSEHINININSSTEGRGISAFLDQEAVRRKFDKDRIGKGNISANEFVIEEQPSPDGVRRIITGELKEPIKDKETKYDEIPERAIFIGDWQDAYNLWKIGVKGEKPPFYLININWSMRKIKKRLRRISGGCI